MLLIMRRASLAQGLMAKVRDAPGIQLCYEPDYANADVAIRSHLASGALLEVSEDGDHGIDFCLALCAWLREVTPHCRLMLMCPEGQPEAVSRAIEAKRRGEIDDFVFYDVWCLFLTTHNGTSTFINEGSAIMSNGYNTAERHLKGDLI